MLREERLDEVSELLADRVGFLNTADRLHNLFPLLRRTPNMKRVSITSATVSRFLNVKPTILRYRFFRSLRFRSRSLLLRLSSDPSFPSSPRKRRRSKKQ